MEAKKISSPLALGRPDTQASIFANRNLLLFLVPTVMLQRNARFTINTPSHT